VSSYYSALLILLAYWVFHTKSGNSQRQARLKDSFYMAQMMLLHSNQYLCFIMLLLSLELQMFTFFTLLFFNFAFQVL